MQMNLLVMRGECSPKNYEQLQKLLKAYEAAFEDDPTNRNNRRVGGLPHVPMCQCR